MPKLFRALPLLAFAGLAGCGSYPRDVGHTLDHVRRGDPIRVGFAELDPAEQRLAVGFVAAVAAASAGRSAPPRRGSTEALLARLEAGELDLVVAELAEDSPWRGEVAVIEPLALRPVGHRRIGLSAVAANGENSWVSLLERVARDQGEAR